MRVASFFGEGVGGNGKMVSGKTSPFPSSLLCFRSGFVLLLNRGGGGG